MLAAFYDPYDPFGTAAAGHRERVERLSEVRDEIQRWREYIGRLEQKCIEFIAENEAADLLLKEIVDEANGKKPRRLSLSKQLRNQFRDEYTSKRKQELQGKDLISAGVDAKFNYYRL